EVLLNVMVGCFSASKKSALFKWLSLGSTLVSIEFVCTVSSTTASLKSSLAETIDTSYELKCPGTSAIPKWVTVKPNLEWYGSAVHVVWANNPIETNRDTKNKVNFFIFI